MVRLVPKVSHLWDNVSLFHFSLVRCDICTFSDTSRETSKASVSRAG
jgi:hypothetical protein